jgi:hypothetical protein
MMDVDEDMEVQMPDANFRQNNIRTVGTEEERKDVLIGNTHI